jgi:hypothetical protein
LADGDSGVTTAAPPQATNAATPGVRATAASLEPSLPAPTGWARVLSGEESAEDYFDRTFGARRDVWGTPEAEEYIRSLRA